MAAKASIGSILQKHQAQVQSAWLEELTAGSANSGGRVARDALHRQAGDFLNAFNQALRSGRTDAIDAPEWADTRAFLDELSEQRANAGFSSEETATFIFSLKRPLFAALRDSVPDPRQFAEDVWETTVLLDALGLHTVKAFQRAREEVIVRQQQDLLELSTPVVKLWKGILALPMIGTLDSARTQVVMESLLQKIVETESEIAILDITGVPTVDTLVAQHLLKTVTAIRLMGAECIISGVRPQIAQTIVHLGVDLQGVTTKANLADALSLALKRLGITVSG
jgi:rsbT co-antagonist protein RsbR